MPNLPRVNLELDNWIEAFKELAEDSEAPDLFIEWAALFSLAAVTTRKLKCEFGHLKIIINLWVLLVSPPGVCRKGDAIGFIDMVLDPLKFNPETYQGTIHVAYESLTREFLLEQFRIAKECYINSLVSGGSLPRAVEQQSMAPLVVISREFGSFISRKDEQFFSDLCDLFDSKPEFRYGTKSSGVVVLRRPWISIIGATQPSALSLAWPQYASSGGFLPRFILVCGVKPKKRVSLMHLKPLNYDLLDALRRDLYKLNQLSGQFQFTDEAAQVYDDWYFGLDKVPPPGNDHRLQDYASRRSTHVIKLACLHCMATSGGLLVSGDDMRYAINLLHRTEQYMPLGIVSAEAQERFSLRFTILDFIKSGINTVADLYTLIRPQLDLSDLQRLLHAMYKERQIVVEPEGALVTNSRSDFLNAKIRYQSQQSGAV